MDLQLTQEARFWADLDRFILLSEQALCTGAALCDAEELLLGWPLPGDLPMAFAYLTGGKAFPSRHPD